MRLFHRLLVTVLLISVTIPGISQTGISVSPPRLYFESGPGESTTRTFTVSNVSRSNTLDLAISYSDWKYDRFGDNMMLPPDSLDNTCASWLSISKEDNFFSLKPGEKKEIRLTLTVPEHIDVNIPVHTALLFVTQMNPIDDVNREGANIKVNVRSGIKIFHRIPGALNRIVEIQNMAFRQDKNQIDVVFNNKGNVWADGYIYTDLLHIETGSKTELNKSVFYSMPENIREMNIPLPDNLEKGRYIATILIDYGNEENMEMAELTFTYE